MGWYAFVPGMECYHGILSMDHAVEGFIEVNGIRKDLNGGGLYREGLGRFNAFLLDMDAD